MDSDRVGRKGESLVREEEREKEWCSLEGEKKGKELEERLEAFAGEKEREMWCLEGMNGCLTGEEGKTGA